MGAPFADEPGGIAAAELAEERKAVADDNEVGFNVAKGGQQVEPRLRIAERRHTSRDLSGNPICGIGRLEEREQGNETDDTEVRSPRVALIVAAVDILRLCAGRLVHI